MILRSRHGVLVRVVMMVAAAGLFVVGYQWGNQLQFGSEPPAIDGVLMRPPMVLPDFALKDARGVPFANADLADRWTLLAVGDLAQARGHLAVNRMIGVSNVLVEDRHLRPGLQLVLLVPGEASELALDFSRLSQSLRVLAGEPGAAAASLVTALGEDAPAAGEASLYLVGPNGRLVALFPAGQHPESIAADVAALARRPDLYQKDENDG